MSELFIRIVNMSISASWIVLAVLLLRLVLKKAPKWITVLLWGIVAVRLICPFSLESALSLVPSAETISPEIMMDATPEVQTGISFINSAVNPVITQSFSPAPLASANPLQIWIPVASVVWIAGIIGMLAYTAISYWRVKRKIGTAVLLRDNIFQSENAVSPFVLGILRPKIYLPFQINRQDMAHVIAHENAHIRRKDHLWKPLGFLLLSIHWFNPLMWLGYVLLCRDIELACDEKVIKAMDTEQKADYSQALLTCSVNRRMIAACPLAFGEVSVKNRIKTVLNYKKPAFWIIIVAIVASLVVAVCFLTNPPTGLNTEMSAFIEEQILEHHNGMYKSGEFCCTDFKVLGKQKRNGKTTVYMLVLYQEYTDDNGKIEDISGGYTPTAITFRKSGGGPYELVEYWESEDGALWAPSIQEKFGMYLYGKVLWFQEINYIKKQQEACDAKAAAYFASVSQVGKVDEPENVVTYIDLETTFSYAGYTKDHAIYYSDRNLTYVPWSDILDSPIYRLDTPEDLQWFKDNMGIHYNMDQGYKEVPSFNSVSAKYDGDFFESNSLILVYLGQNNITRRFAVQNVEYGNVSFGINLKETTGEKELDSMLTGWFITVAVPDEIVEDCTNFYIRVPGDPSGVVYYFPDEAGEFTIRKHYAQTPAEEISELIEKEEFVYTHLHYLDTFDEKWICEGYEYAYRLEITGRLNNAAKNTTYIVLCNESITFDQAWKASGLSSNTADYFDPADAVIVGYRNFS